MHEGMTGMVKQAAGMKGRKTADRVTSSKRKTFQEKGKEVDTGYHLRRSQSVSLSVDALFVSCVMCVCVMRVWRKHWQLSRVNVSCCSAVQADARSVIDVSLCCVRQERCDFLFCLQRESNQSAVKTWPMVKHRKASFVSSQIYHEDLTFSGLSLHMCSYISADS